MPRISTLHCLLLFGLCLFLVACQPLAPQAPQPSTEASTESTDPSAAERFLVVNEAAGIDATHAGSWDEYRKGVEFTDGYQGMGQAWGDYDNDGWVDLYVTGGLEPSVLFRNQGDGSFARSQLSEQVSLPDSWTGGAVWADYDNDGWRDLYVLAHGANTLFHNEGGSGFRDVTAQAGVGDRGKGTIATWGDYDGDSFLDLYVGNGSCYPACDPVDFTQSQDRLYHNNGDGTFGDVSADLGIDKLTGAAFSASFVDYDNDRDPDLYVVNDKLQNPIGNVLWRNDGPGDDGWLWTDVSAETGTDTVLHGMGLAVGDYDNDQDLDFFFTNMVDPSVLLQNQDGALFTEQSAGAGLPMEVSEQVGWGTAFFDYDNDGWQDLYVATTAFIMFTPMEGPWGMLLDFPNFLYRNDGAGGFEDRSPHSWSESPAPSMGFATADYDRDGWVDFVTGDWNQGYRLHRNRGAEEGEHHWLEVKLIGGGRVNRDAIGARVYLTLNDGRKLMQEVKAGSSIGAGNDTTLHFGLGDAAVRSAVVIWPNGQRRLYFNVPQDRVWHVAIPGMEDDPILARYRASFAEPFVDVTEAAGIDAPHQATWAMHDPDFTTGYLGVGQAWGDYDGDGWLDLYVTGNELPNILYRNNGDGSFAISEHSQSLDMAGSRAGGAVWADYDNDGWKDHYVLAHGANQLVHNEQGTGFRNVTERAGVGDMGKGSTATWGDYDGDGYIDLYVANWACYPECDPLDFSRSQDRLYHNDGNGAFSDVSDLLGYEKLLGAGFTASFVDYDNDFDPDLYVVNDSLMNPIGNVLWRNDGPGCGGWCWSDVSTETGAGIVIEGMGLAVGDYDNDLDLDLYFSNMVNPSALIRNEGDGSFVEISDSARVGGELVGTVGWGAAFLDYDNDGWLDLFLSTTEFRNLDAGTPPDGMHFAHPNLLFHNEQNGVFRNASPAIWLELPKPSMGMASADYDRDGWVDFVTGDWNQRYRLYRNESQRLAPGRWLSVRLVGGGPVNRDAIGARVLLSTTDGRTQMQEVKSGSSLGAGNDTALHFGLGNATVDSITVIWPNREQTILDVVAADQELVVAYGDVK